MQNGQQAVIRLEAVTRDNFFDVVALKVAPEQQEFVASNAFSLAESKYFPELKPFAIYAGESLVGFVMYGQDEDTGRVWIVRLDRSRSARQGVRPGRAHPDYCRYSPAVPRRRAVPQLRAGKSQRRAAVCQPWLRANRRNERRRNRLLLEIQLTSTGSYFPHRPTCPHDQVKTGQPAIA